MLRRTTKLCLLSLACLALLWVFTLIYVSPADLSTVKKILDEQEVVSSKSILSTTEQQRKGVVKEIWFTQDDNSRLHYRISSESSLLTIKPEGKKFDLIEKLENIKCWMQDKLYAPALENGPMQQIRFLQAHEGIYRFASQEFLAQTVALSFYRLQGHELPRELKDSSAFLKGIAQDVSFAVSGKNPQFKAQHFKAELNSLEGKK